MSYQGHAWTWHPRVPAWSICRDCLATRKPGPAVGAYLYRKDGETEFRAEEPACPRRFRGNRAGVSRRQAGRATHRRRAMNIEEVTFIRSYLARRPNAEPYEICLAYKRYVRHTNNDPLEQPLSVRYLGRLQPKALRQLLADSRADDIEDLRTMRARLNAAFHGSSWRIVSPSGLEEEAAA